MTSLYQEVEQSAYLVSTRAATAEQSTVLCNPVNRPALTPSPDPELALVTDWSALTQDLINSLPRAWTRGLLYCIVFMTAIALPWSVFSQVDETGTARGRLEPQGKSYRLDAAASGEVMKIYVKEGDTVKAGQVLIQLDTDLLRTDLQQTQARLEGQLNRLVQLKQIEHQLSIASRTQQLQNQAQLAEHQAQLDQVRQQLASRHQDEQLLQVRLDEDQQEVQRYLMLRQQDVVPETKLLEMERVAADSFRQLGQIRAETKQSLIELAKQQKASDRIQHTGELALLDSQRQLEEWQTQFSDLRAEIAQTHKSIASLQLQLQRRSILAPVNGKVFQLSVAKPGAVVQTGQAIAQIAPQGVPLVFKAQMPSSESGFLKVNMPVKLKFDAYPFQDYGVLPGRLRWIAPDSKTIQTSQGEVEMFELEIALEQSAQSSEAQRIIPTAGQAGTAEVVVRQRRIIDLLLDPFRQLQKGGFKL